MQALGRQEAVLGILECPARFKDFPLSPKNPLLTFLQAGNLCIIDTSSREPAKNPSSHGK
jgi:hypothetical protein